MKAEPIAPVVPASPLCGFRTLGGPIQAGGATLLIVCDFGLTPPPGGSRLWRWLHFTPIRDFFYHRTKVAALPLSLERQISYAAAFLAETGAEPLDMVLCGHRAASLSSALAGVRHVREAVGDRLPVDASAYDTVLLSYPDPLGLGWSALEKLLLQTWDKQRRPVLVLNGRGRIMPLTEKNRALLANRRFWARTRLLEMALGLSAFPVAFFLALRDKSARRS